MVTAGALQEPHPGPHIALERKCKDGRGCLRAGRWFLQFVHTIWIWTLQLHHKKLNKKKKTFIFYLFVNQYKVLLILLSVNQ